MGLSFSEWYTQMMTGGQSLDIAMLDNFDNGLVDDCFQDKSDIEGLDFNGIVSTLVYRALEKCDVDENDIDCNFNYLDWDVWWTRDAVDRLPKSERDSKSDRFNELTGNEIKD